MKLDKLAVQYWPNLTQLEVEAVAMEVDLEVPMVEMAFVVENLQ